MKFGIFGTCPALPCPPRHQVPTLPFGGLELLGLSGALCLGEVTASFEIFYTLYGKIENKKVSPFWFICGEELALV